MELLEGMETDTSSRDLILAAEHVFLCKAAKLDSQAGLQMFRRLHAARMSVCALAHGRSQRGRAPNKEPLHQQQPASSQVVLRDRGSHFEPGQAGPTWQSPKCNWRGKS